MRKKTAKFLVIVLVIFLLFFLANCAKNTSQNQVFIDTTKSKILCAENQGFSCNGKNLIKINVEIADDNAEMEKGLMFREKLNENEGMLFVFEESSFQGFWMKETFIPLDIIWIDNSKEVVHIKRRVPPCEKDPCKVYKAPKIAKYVLEINSGYADTLGLMEGDIAVIDYE